MSENSGIEKLLTKVENKTVLDLLDKNHKEHHIFFGPKFHNHFAHAALTYYALGASDEKVKKEYKEESSYLLPMPPTKSTVINESNWKQFIGDDSYYPNYLSFFAKEVEAKGPVETIVQYALERESIPSLVAGAVHPLIHIGFGVEFQLPQILSEGLAMMAIHSPAPKPLFDFEHGDHLKGKTGLEIALEIKHDKSLDGLIDYSDSNKTKSTIEKAAGIIKNYAKDWVVVETKECIAEKFEDLFKTAATLYATSCFDPRNPHSEDVKLDFFIMHVLTSSMAVRQIIPHLNLNQARTLLKTHFPMALLYYIARGRPDLHPEILKEYKSKIFNIKNWEDVVALTFKQEDLHAAKVIRALKTADEMFNKDGNNSLFFDAAAITMDHFANKGGDWDQSAIGFEQAWNRE